MLQFDGPSGKGKLGGLENKHFNYDSIHPKAIPSVGESIGQFKKPWEFNIVWGYHVRDLKSGYGFTKDK